MSITTPPRTASTRSTSLAVLAAVGACTAALTYGAVPARAQIIVLNSTAPGLKAGQILEQGTSLAIPEGASVVVVLPSGASRTVQGPFKGKTAELTRGSPANAALFAAVRKYVQTGGTTTRNAGAMRSSVGPRLASGPATRFSWQEIPVRAQGDVCVERGAQLTLVRTDAGAPLSVTVVNLNSTQRSRVEFGANDTSVIWPADLKPESGSFALLAAAQPMRQIRLRLISPLPAPDQTLRVLHGQRCTLQFQAFLATMMQVGSATPPAPAPAQ